MRLLALTLLALLPGASGYRRPAQGAFAPMIAMSPGYRNRFLTEDLRWFADPGSNAQFTNDTLEILRYCRIRYPNRNISSVVESAQEMVLGDRNVPTELKLTVKPWRCVEGTFSTEVIFHPEGCAYRKSEESEDFDNCYRKEYWESEAEKQCRE
uniref:A4_EXTRA domain-containing protein n=1 Tax=Steinernema glaseri TaxID=37863 RepID=A0A1I8AL71_9BILA